MPSVLHEVLVELFRSRPTMAAKLLVDVFGIELPPHTEAQLSEATLTQMVATEYRADLVVLLRAGKAVYAIVVEIQLGVDTGKRFSWPVYSAAVRSEHHCPVAVLVVTPYANVASWASETIVLGPGHSFAPTVLGPDGVPWVSTEEEALEAPQLAVLSALAHGNEPGGVRAVLSAIAGLYEVDDESRKVYYDLMWASLNEVAKKELEALALSEKYEYQSDFAKKYLAQGQAEGRMEGRVEGRTEMLFAFLRHRGFEPTAELRARIESADEDQILTWFARALDAADVAQVFREH